MNRVLAPPSRIASRRTPDVFEMFKVHQSGVVVAFDPLSREVSAGDDNILLVSASTTEADDHSVVRLSLVNTSPAQTVKLSLRLAQLTPTSLAGSVLTAPPVGMRRVTTTQPPWPTAFDGATLDGRTLAIAVPARSVVVLMVR
jgi:alpha-N-arabinofuranosidase